MNRLKLCACAVAWLVVVGFTPAAPASETIAGYWPRTCEEAIDILAAVLPAGSKAELRTTARSGLVPLNDDLGKQIRTNFGLYRGNVELMASCAARAGATRKHPDNTSLAIIEGVWDAIQEN